VNKKINMNPYKDYLALVNVFELLEKISKFRNLNFRKMTYQDISKAILNVLSIDKNGIKKSCLFKSFGIYNKGTKFFRVRTLSTEDHCIPLKDIKIPKDVWNPPQSIARLGRLNRENESLLYTSPNNPSIAIEETKIKENTNFVLAVFEAIDDIRVCNMATTPTIEELNEEENLKHKIINDFLVHEFIRDVGTGTEFLYKISETIMKDYYDLPHEVQDGWCYPSVAHKDSYNMCFRENKAKEKLKLKGIQIAVKVNDDKGMKIYPKIIGLSNADNEEFKYFKIGSNEQKKVFPEIINEKLNLTDKDRLFSES